MREILEEPFSRIVNSKNTELIIVTPIPGSEEEINEVAQDYAKLLPTRLFYQYGIGIKDTPDGELTQHVLIWHVIWDRDEGKVPPLLEDIHPQ